MNSSAHLVIGPGGILVMLLLVTVAFVLSRRFRAKPALRRAASAIESSANISSFATTSVFPSLRLAREFAWLAVPFVVIASFGMTTDPREFLSGWGLSTEAVTPLSPSSPPNSVEVETDQVPISTVSTTVHVLPPSVVL